MIRCAKRDCRSRYNHVSFEVRGSSTHSTVSRSFVGHNSSFLEIARARRPAGQRRRGCQISSTKGPGDMVIDCSAPDGGFVVRNLAPAAVSLTVAPSLDPASMVCHYWFTPTNALPSREDRIHVIFSDGGSEPLPTAQ